MTLVLKKKKSVRFTLYIYNLLLIILTVGFFSTFFYWFTSRLLKNRVVDSFKDISTSLVTNLDNEILKMNILSLNVAYSKVFDELVAERLFLYSGTFTKEQDRRIQGVQKALRLPPVHHHPLQARAAD